MSFYDNILGVLPPAIGADDAPSDDWTLLAPSIAAFIGRRPTPDVAAGEAAGDRRSLPSTFYDNILGRPFLGTASPPPAALPRSVMNSRRFTRSPRRRAAGGAKARRARAPWPS